MPSTFCARQWLFFVVSLSGGREGIVRGPVCVVIVLCRLESVSGAFGGTDGRGGGCIWVHFWCDDGGWGEIRSARRGPSGTDKEDSAKELYADAHESETQLCWSCTTEMDVGSRGSRPPFFIPYHLVRANRMSIRRHTH